MLDLDRFRRGLAAGLPALALIPFSIAAALLAGAAAAEVNVAVSATFAGGTGNGFSFGSQWDRNGRFAIFLSQAQNMIPGQTTAAGDNKLFLFDRLAGSVKLVSHIPGNAATGANAGVRFSSPQISADGNWVVYVSAATNLVSGQVDGNGDQDVFLWHRLTDTTLLVSHGAASATTAGDGASGRQPTLSGDGRFVTYTSLATNLVTGQVGNAFEQIYQFDRSSGTNLLVSHASNDPLRSSNETCARPSSSTDGRWVAFQTLATNLASGITDGNANTDVYLWDRQAAPASSLRLLSRRAGFPLDAGNGLSELPRLSADGSGVAFRTLATNLEGSTSDTNAGADIFHYNRPADLLSLVSHRFSDLTAAGNGGTGDRAPSISADGDRVAFLSSATDVVFQQTDSNAAADVFFWNGGTLTLISHVPNDVKQTGNAVSTDQIIYPDGRGVAFASRASNLVAGVTDTTSDIDLFFRPANLAQTFLITHLAGDETTTIGDLSTPEAVAAGGALVSYSTGAEGVVGDDGNGIPDVFVHGSLLLADGFESGDFSAWSLHLP